MLEDANRSGFLTNDLRNLLNIEPADNAEEDNFGLIGWEPGDVCKRGLCFTRREGLRLWIDGDVRLHRRQSDENASPLLATAEID
jgi:hypothetical protein